MNTLITAGILTAWLVPAAELRHRDVVDVFRCDFEVAADQNFDRWPDGWTRQRDMEHPAYLRIEITDSGSPQVGKCLQVELNGGAATAFSPPIEVSPHFSYVLGGTVRTAGLNNDVAYCDIVFYDADDGLVYRHRTHDLNSVEWESFLSESISLSQEEVRYAVIELHLEPRDGEQPDLRGSAYFDDIWLGRLPRMSLVMNRTNHLYADGDDVEITCRVSGVPDRNPSVRFELYDVMGSRLATNDQWLNGEPVQNPATGTNPSDANLKSSDMGYAGVVTWKPPLPEYGFYRVHVTMSAAKGVIHQDVISLAVLCPIPMAPRSGEFGWTLPTGDEHASMEQLADLTMHAGVSWVKFPVWYGAHETSRPEQITWFAERLKANGTQLIGILDQPPADVRDLFGEAETLQSAQVFADADLWQRHLNPVITRLSLKVRWWQLGTDADISFVGYPNLMEKLEEVRQQLEKFGQEAHLGIAWQWLYQPPTAQRPPWRFFTFTSDPPLTADELQAYLQPEKEFSEKRWVAIEPLSNRRYPDLKVRAKDLVHRLITGKVNAADAMFLPDPFDSERGVMHADATPSELFLPWRTTSRLLSGTRFIGEFEMPQGSQNRVFESGDQAIVVLWNSEPTTETMFLGKDVRMLDIWGRMLTPPREGSQHVIPVGPEPIFLTGVNLAVARWRLNFSFDRESLASIFGRSQRAFYHIYNSFPQGVTGTMHLHAPEGWETDLRGVNFKLAEGSDRNEPFAITLQPVARSGNHRVRVDFRLSAEKIYNFSVYRQLELGLGDVAIEVSTSIDDKGNLVVSQQLTNQSNAFVNFDCMLFVPDRLRQRRHVLNLGRGRNVQTYLLPRGEELLGKTLWLRAEEIGGERMLNHQILVER